VGVNGFEGLRCGDGRDGGGERSWGKNERDGLEWERGG